MKILNASILIILISLSSCGTKRWGNPTGIEIEVPAEARINHGHSFEVNTYLVFDSGKRKDMSRSSDLTFAVKGAQVDGKKFRIEGMPTQFGSDTVWLRAQLNYKDSLYSSTKEIPFNYKGDLNIDLSGEQGQAGPNGSSGGTPIVFRDGKDGDDGGIGLPGMSGHDIQVHVYKNDSGLYKLRLISLITNETYYFTNKDVGFPIIIGVRGGKGGNGGAGGSGGDGKDGKKTDKKEKLPGDGGNGGNGGQGGNGGNGGSVYLFIHPTAADIQSRITVYNTGGAGGDAGAGGAAGRPGSALENQTEGIEGNSGLPGPEGIPGASGEATVITVEPFDIDF